MARIRKTSKEALEEKIEKAEADVIAAKKKYDQATANLKELLDKRDAIRKEEILSAVVKSGRSYEEIMNFLNAGSDGEKTENRVILSHRYSDPRFRWKKTGNSH